MGIDGDDMNDLSPKDARRIAMGAQGLVKPATFGRGKYAVQRVIDTLGYVQIDTISVVDRAHHHVLTTRVPNFAPSMLRRLQQTDRAIFEYWSHAAAYLPMADYRYYTPMMDGFGKTRSVDRKIARVILDRVRTDGPVQSRDFEAPPEHSSGGWWDWKPAKLTLEQLFLSGRLMVSHRDGFQKVFDLPERVLPQHVDTSRPTWDEFAHYFVRKMASSIGIGTEADISYPAATMQRMIKRDPPIRRDFVRVIREMAEAGELIAVHVDGQRYYATPDAIAGLPRRLGRRRVQILSPFDNLVINRRRLSALFGFDYQIECYLPASKRQFGYFCLPLLWGDEFVGRLDAKAHRDQAVLEVKSLHFEPGVDAAEPRLRAAMDAALEDFAAANGCTEVDVTYP